MLPLPLPLDTQDTLAGLETRQHPLRLDELQDETHDYRFTLPAGCGVDIPIPNADDHTPFGDFEFSAQATGATLRIRYRMTATKREIGTNDYPAFRDFLVRASQATRQVLTLHPPAP